MAKQQLLTDVNNLKNVYFSVGSQKVTSDIDLNHSEDSEQLATNWQHLPTEKSNNDAKGDRNKRQQTSTVAIRESNVLPGPDTNDYVDYQGIWASQAKPSAVQRTHKVDHKALSGCSCETFCLSFLTDEQIQFTRQLNQSLTRDNLDFFLMGKFSAIVDNSGMDSSKMRRARLKCHNRCVYRFEGKFFSYITYINL